MADRLRFHLDENVDPAIADGLRHRGIDVTLPSDVGLVAASDAEHFAYALRDQRVIVTHDEDFLAAGKGGITAVSLSTISNLAPSAKSSAAYS